MGNLFKSFINSKDPDSYSEFIVLDPDPGSKFITDPPDPDPPHWKKGPQLFANLLVIYYGQLTPYVKKMRGAVFSFFSYSENFKKQTIRYDL